jgi:hypothetical protein
MLNEQDVTLLIRPLKQTAIDITLPETLIQKRTELVFY